MPRCYYRGGEQVAFEPQPDLIATSTRGDAAFALPGGVGTRAAVSDAIASQGVHLIELPSAAAERGDREVERSLAEIESQPGVEWAGAVLKAEDELVSFVTREVVVRLVSDSRGVVPFAERHGFDVVRALPQRGGAFVLRSRRPASYGLLDRLVALAAEDVVDWCEPSLVTTVQLDAIHPAQYLWPGAWDRRLVGVDHAWTLLERAGLNALGDPTITIAIVDQGITSEVGRPVHSDFAGAVSDGRSKVARFFDFRLMRPDNDAALGNHGVGAAGVAAGNASRATENDVEPGVPGAAPNCRLMGLVPPRSEVDQLDMYLWAAGFDAGSTRPGFPPQLEKGVDILSTSIGLGAGAPISRLASDTLDFISRRGRDGRGCPMFFSVGNAGDDFTTLRPWAAHRRIFGVGASTLAADGMSEVRARYSGRGPLALCAPSHDRFPMQHDPPEKHATWTCDLIGRGNLIGHPSASARLRETAVAGAIRLELDTVDGFEEGGRLLIGEPGERSTEVTTIAEVDAEAASLAVSSPLGRSHAQGSVLATGPGDYRNDFGGTSSATSLAAGVAALVLSANPDLSCEEVRAILFDTAERIEADTDDPNGRWIDALGEPARESGRPPVRSDWFGHGRVDAVAAVSRALSQRAVTPRRVTMPASA